MRAWTAFKAGLLGALTATMLWHWQVVEAQAEPIPAVIATATSSVAAPAEEIYFAERIPTGSWVPAGRHRITHYCPGRCCNGSNAGRTASGAPMVSGHTVAASKHEFPFGTQLLINRTIYTVEDRGVGTGCIDILVDSHREALRRGLYYTDIFVWREY